MVNLKELYLQKTNIDGSGLLYLTNLPNLERLNLSFTKIDDRAAIDLLKVPKLKEVYLYRTNTTKEVIEALSKNKPSLSLLVEEGPYF
jgi:Leucine-rich repeat (LRR) protein